MAEFFFGLSVGIIVGVIALVIVACILAGKDNNERKK